MNIGFTEIRYRTVLDPNIEPWLRNDGLLFLKELALRHPEHKFILTGRIVGGDPQTYGYPENVINPYIGIGRSTDEIRSRTMQVVSRLDGLVVQLVTVLATSMPTPKLREEGMTKPLQMAKNSSIPIEAINAWQDLDPENEPLYISNDPRSTLRARDIKRAPRRPVLAMADMEEEGRHWNFGDETIPGDEKGYYFAKHVYEYAGVELMGFPDVDLYAGDRNDRFVVIANEKRADKRGELIQNVIFPAAGRDRVDVFGDWTNDTQEALGIRTEHVPTGDFFQTLGSYRYTAALPASKSGWATAKAWECFAAGVICFFLPGYDAQGHVIPGSFDGPQEGEVVSTENYLAAWLRVEGVDELQQKIKQLDDSDETRRYIIAAQRHVYEQAREENLLTRKVEERLGL